MTGSVAVAGLAGLPTGPVAVPPRPERRVVRPTPGGAMPAGDPPRRRGQRPAPDAGDQLDDEDVLLGTQDIAHRLRVDLLTAQRLCRTGEIPATKIGRSWYISQAAWRALFPDVPPRTPPRAPAATDEDEPTRTTGHHRDAP